MRFHHVASVLIIVLLLTAACNLTSTEPETPTVTATTYTLPEATAVPTLVPRMTHTPTVEPTVTTLPPTAATITATAPTPIPSPTVPDQPNGRITGAVEDGQNLYTEADDSSQVLALLYALSPVTITGRTKDNQWLQVTLDDGRKGWLSADLIETDLDLDTVPVGGAAEMPDNTTIITGVVKPSATGLRLRDEPGITSTILTSLEPQTTLTINARLEDNSWLQITTPGGYTGWVASEHIAVTDDISGLPVVIIQQPTLTAPTIGDWSEDAEVIAEGTGLRVRTEPSIAAQILANLESFDKLHIVGRTDDNSWLQVQAEPGASPGWVWGAYLRVGIDLGAIPVTGEAAPMAPFNNTAISGVSLNAHQIYLRGKALGNRPNVFTKVGDSITFTEWFLTPIGQGNYELLDYAYLQPVINFFSQNNLPDGNSFTHRAITMSNGSTTDGVLNPEYADPNRCQPGESPLACEYRLYKPSVALIMLGTNDIIHVPLPDGYRERINKIVDISAEMGVIPVLSTIPNRVGYEKETAQINEVIIQTARSRDIPLWDFNYALSSLPNGGLAEDGIHPSMPPYPTSTANFTDQNLQYGYIVRNLTALQALDSVWRYVLSAG